MLKFYGKDGWPVERIRGRAVVNAIRLLLHTRHVRWCRCGSAHHMNAGAKHG